MAFEIERDWTTQAGLRAVVVINKSGERRTHRCGYVGIPKTHPLFGVSYHAQADCLSAEMVENQTVGKKSPILALTAMCGADTENSIRRSPDVAFDVHGGLTYSGESGEYPAKAEDLWWYGFDCRHYGDGEIEPDPYYAFHEGPVRDLDYVSAECESLAQQLAAL